MIAKKQQIPARFDRADLWAGKGEYIEFQLDAGTLRQVKAMARAERCSPFEMCVSLLQDEICAKKKVSCVSCGA